MSTELTSNVKIVSCITPAAGAAGTSAITGSTIDTANAEGVLIALHMGPIVSGAVTSVKVMAGETTTPTTDLAGTSISIADTQDNEIIYVDVKRPQHRFMALCVTRGTQNATVGSAIAYVYGQRESGFSQPAGVTGKVLASPSAGVA